MKYIFIVLSKVILFGLKLTLILLWYIVNSLIFLWDFNKKHFVQWETSNEIDRTVENDNIRITFHVYKNPLHLLLNKYEVEEQLESNNDYWDDIYGV